MQNTEDLVSLSRRRYHIEPGPREKALLAEDSALKPFKSYKKSVKQLRRIGDVLTIVVVAGMLSFNPGFDERSEGLSPPGTDVSNIKKLMIEDPDAVMKYMSEQLQEKKLGISKVLKVQNEGNIGMLVFFTLYFYGNNLDVMFSHVRISRKAFEPKLLVN
ncbi:hypothetical protein SESBI_40239 [Sesbania bispinosa]|nr:hypothetical protein SESBI_40239 [Sesbania bispinosa]